MAKVTAGARLHFGFQSLSLARERLYGGVGVALAEPRIVLTARPASTVRADDPRAAEYAERAVELLDVPGVELELHERFRRHVGLGSGTQLALAVLAAVARAHDHEPRVRERAPALGRGGRSGVGCAAFEQGGFVVDAGHHTERFTADPPTEGEWTVPRPVARHTLPDSWRFVVTIPDLEAGRSGDREERSLERVAAQADPAITDEIAKLVARRLLPAAAEGALRRFGSAIAELGRLNGAWYADEQGGVYRPPLGDLIDDLGASSAITGAGQSSWGPAVYGLTDDERAEDARDAARGALSSVGVDGEVLVCRPRNEGARTESSDD
ncbi:beta-ribofuranosylaminobenzene 5'-phosphate synthase family protein [Halococcus saccharolyticus]|uniref:Beta-ribofuranosylaminobenzene 5'-phosphate synthase n=1 Tax=Halococcus saccharolyticus DSM 5350 TaxID=1227455 RepID=M0MFC0_9EURY|nr:beta-ribofuranosylaminobenzene 5'-phosphate synthase family protein [Halococcus saccharolyticus]EMA44432.1 beta-ribofuranosylaminobenzene 5'-phosphate synthase [Halococcus saccharolyticus DSM 5350]